jgi:hypothetical protein
LNEEGISKASLQSRVHDQSQAPIFWLSVQEEKGSMPKLCCQQYPTIAGKCSQLLIYGISEANLFFICILLIEAWGYRRILCDRISLLLLF